ncbi:MAG: hypothetical protein ABI808_08520 [Pseudonocardiales bacterium]
MITHYAITMELGQQRRAEIAAGVAASRRPRSEGRQRWSALRSLRRHLTDPVTAAAPAGMTRAAATI